MERLIMERLFYAIIDYVKKCANALKGSLTWFESTWRKHPDISVERIALVVLVWLVVAIIVSLLWLGIAFFPGFMKFVGIATMIIALLAFAGVFTYIMIEIMLI